MLRQAPAEATGRVAKNGDSQRPQRNPPVYVVTDVEVDGPVPGENSMLSFASVAVGEDGHVLDEFEAVLDPLEDARPDPATLAWIKSQPEVWAALKDDPQPASRAITDYVEWVGALGGDPVFVAHPLAMDGPWIDHYLKRFAGIRLLKGPWEGTRLFYDGGLCLRSFAAGRLGRPLRLCSPEHYDPSWLGGHRHTHKAIDDARGYAALLGHFLKDAE